LDTTIGQTKHK